MELRMCSRRHHVGRRRRSQQQRERAGVAPRRPPAQLDHLRRWARRHHLDERPQVRPLGFGLDAVGDDPTAHAPPVQRDAHDGADPHDAGDAVRDEVVEGARDRGEIRLDPADPRFDYASASAALRSTSASSVRSHVNVGSRRPKCPYAAVFW